jgi:hypothetical protein
MVECLSGGVEPPAAYHRCFFCQVSLTAGEKYIEHMRHHLVDYKNLQPLLTAAPSAASPAQPLQAAAGKTAVRVRRFRKRRLKPAHVKVVKQEQEEDEERGGYGSGHAVSDDDCLGDSELSDSDSDSCQQQTEKVNRVLIKSIRIYLFLLKQRMHDEKCTPIW